MLPRMSILDGFRLDGKVAIVTGASSGLGVAFARGLAEAGADVAVGARRVERLRGHPGPLRGAGGARRVERLEDTRALVEAAGRRAFAERLDVADPDSCAAFVEATVAALG